MAGKRVYHDDLTRVSSANAVHACFDARTNGESVQRVVVLQQMT